MMFLYFLWECLELIIIYLTIHLSWHRVESEEERATDKETICELKRAIVHQQEAITQQQEEWTL